MTARLTTLALALLAASAASAAPAAFQLADLQKIVHLSEARISPDGKQVALIVATPDWKTDKPRLELDLVDVASGARRVLTQGREGLASPRWSPDGSRLAFLAEFKLPAADAGDDPADEATAQVFVLAMNGGDAQRVTAAPRGVDAFAWSPDGAQFAYTTPDAAPNAKAIKAYDDAIEVTDNHFLTRVALTPSHLWVVASTGGAARRLTEGAYSLQTDQQDAPSAPVWRADGRAIAFTRYPGPYWGASFKSVLETIALDGAAEPVELAPAQGAAQALYAPGGVALAYQRPRGGDQNNGAAVYVVANGTTRDATAALARNVEGYAWLDAQTLLLASAEGTHGALWAQPLGGAARRIELGAVEASADLSVSNGGAIAFVGKTPTHPAELYVLDRVTAAPRQLTHLNAFAEALALGASETVEWQGPGGFHEDGVLTYPVGYEKGRKYPLVLELHGGPEAASLIGFAPLTQLLAAAGFLVFEPNYRGSTDLGDAYQHAIFRDTGDGPGKDVMAGLAAVEKLGIVDTQRVGVSGWSYGGYMTAWLSGHYPDTWKAAVAGAALTDWVMDYTLAYYQQGDTYFFGNSPWSAEGHEIWRAQSPIASAAKVKAPTLILGDVGDPNVPLVNSYEWYHALRDAGVEVRFFAYPVDTHFPADVVRQTDVFRRWVGWMSDHLKR
ncbi:MAG: S9 family peptidase [Pelomonas sp.]|nr:S9 family peptidase [Roseateles sp.]